MKIALIQLNIVFEARQTNYTRAESLIRQASQAACDIAVFPETFSLGYSKNMTITDEEDGETAMFLSAMARIYRINLIAGFAEKVPDSEKAKNLAAVYNRAGVCIATYTKIHPFSFTQEDRYYLPGNRLVTFELEGMKAGIFICYDLRFPEVFRSIAKDVQAIFVVANWPTSRQFHWETLLRARAIENQCFLIGVNRTGTDPQGLHFPGASRIFDPFGQEICVGNDTDELVIGEINLDEVRRIRTTFPFLQDMRPFQMMLS
jgi:omega-amidase